MTEQGERAAEIWRDPSFATSWIAADALTDLLTFPRELAARLVAQDRPGVRSVLDIASGPGAFLSVFLDAFPHAEGTWSDASEVMLQEARAQLAHFGDRVGFVLADMTELTGGGLPSQADVIVTSRAAHHLDKEALTAFYVQAAHRLSPGGWLVNLDHIGPADVWDRRYRSLRQLSSPAASTQPKHHHNYPLTSIADHHAALDAAGLDDHDIAWKAFYTCLFMARKSD